MLGAIIGDIVGSRWEFNPTNDYNFPLFSDKNSYTDDTKPMPLNIYFTSRELALKAIEKVGEERIKKYYFDIDDADCEKQKEEK